MYKYLIRPLLFLFDPEKVHNSLAKLVILLSKIPFISAILSKQFTYESPSLKKELMGLHFPNPVGLAAGFDKNAEYFKEFSVFGFGFIEIGTLTPKPQTGNPKPRSFRLTKDHALINRMGFNNMGVDEAVKKLINRPSGLIIGGNIGKNTNTPENKIVEDYEYCFTRLYDHIDYFVVNVSCPNIGDISRLQDQETVEAILIRLSDLRKLQPVYRPILLKISPDLNFRQIDETIDIILNIGIDGIVAVNTSITREGLKTPMEKVSAIGKGGLSGKPLNNRSNEIIRYIKNKTSIPVIGSGGILTVNDAIEKIKAGADLLQIYTGFIYEGPCFARKINKVLKNLL